MYDVALILNFKNLVQIIKMYVNDIWILPKYYLKKEESQELWYNFNMQNENKILWKVTCAIICYC